MELSTQLKKFDACTEGYEWAKGKTLTEAWSTCERGDWMLWYAAKVNIDRKLLVKAACACARLALKFVPDGEQRPRITIETAEAWTEGKASLNDVRTAAAAAYTAAYTAADAAYTAADAAYAAADAADAATYATDAAYAATYAANAAADAAYAANATDAAYAHTTTLRVCAEIVRDMIPLDALKGDK